MSGRERAARVRSSCGSAAKRQLVFALAQRCAVMETAAHTRNSRPDVARSERPLRSCIMILSK